MALQLIRRNDGRYIRPKQIAVVPLSTIFATIFNFDDYIGADGLFRIGTWQIGNTVSAIGQLYITDNVGTLIQAIYINDIIGLTIDPAAEGWQYFKLRNLSTGVALPFVVWK